MNVDMKTLTTRIVPLLFLLLASAGLSRAGETSRYIRSIYASVDIPKDSPIFYTPPGYNAPQQVHITQGDYEGRAVIVSWIYPENIPLRSEVYYGMEKGMYTERAEGKAYRYRYYNYRSGYIHHTTITGLQYNTTYYYQIRMGSQISRDFFFTTAPNDPNGAYTFGIIGDLGQTYDSLSTLQNYNKSTGQSVLYVGDLSYADMYPYNDNERWDTWGRLIESSAAYQPWIWTAGNHEIEVLPSVGETEEFKVYNYRYPTPYEFSDSTSPLWYAIKRGPATIIVLSSYSAFGPVTPQFFWFLKTIESVDRTVTPWLIVLIHAPLYSSNAHHYMQGEGIRVAYESYFVRYKVDLVFAGHVHSYERSHAVENIKYDIENGKCTPELKDTAPEYMVVGDGGNIQGLVDTWNDPQPSYSAFREASFGYALLQIENQTHALFTWHRNQDGQDEIADSKTVLNKFHLNKFYADK